MSQKKKILVKIAKNQLKDVLKKKKLTGRRKQRRFPDYGGAAAAAVWSGLRDEA